MKLNNEPITLYDEWYYNDNISRYKRRSSMIKEFVDIYNRNVFQIIYKPNDFNDNKIPIGLKWVFNIKDDGIYRSILASKEYNQVEVTDYNGSY